MKADTLLEKARAVVMSCNTPEQAKNARKYLDLVLKQLFVISNDIQDYITLDELDEHLSSIISANIVAGDAVETAVIRMYVSDDVKALAPEFFELFEELPVEFTSDNPHISLGGRNGVLNFEIDN